MLSFLNIAGFDLLFFDDFYIHTLLCQEFLIISLSDFDMSYTRLLGHLMQKKTDSLEKTLMLGKTEGRRRRG